MRLLDKQAGKLDLAQLGMAPDTLASLSETIERPHGILLVTGPTGSGKTTTLYASLLRLNDLSRNIMTVEDPIEYYIDGVGQTQVNTKVDMSFARGLRAILRQDPDVVMIGEIRDLETAQIAVQASLTGHLVLSTLHTNSAVGAVTRLRDMGVEPFLLSSSLLGVLAQRLVRVLDPATREAYAATPRELAAFAQPATTQATLYRPGATNGNRHAGYRGRTGIYEYVVVDETMRRLIHAGAAEAELERARALAHAEHARRRLAQVRRGHDVGRRSAARDARGIAPPKSGWSRDSAQAKRGRHAERLEQSADAECESSAKIQCEKQAEGQRVFLAVHAPCAKRSECAARQRAGAIAAPGDTQ